MVVNKKDILDAWIMVEQLSEGDIKKTDNQYRKFKNNDDFSQELSDFMLLQKKNKKLTDKEFEASGVAIYCGIFPFQEIVDRLRRQYRLHPTDEELSTSEKFTFAIYFNKDLISQETKFFFTMSGYIRYKNELPDNFSIIENDIRDDIKKKFEDGIFNDVFSRLLSDYNISLDNCRYTFVRDLERDSINLHSFFINDLITAKDISTDNLERYLSGFNGERVNLDCHPESLKKDITPFEEILLPKNYPLGRFPSKVEYPLSMMQQVAVNLSLNEKIDIQSVNGPPGTGKTTLLKDIFAQLIVEQAKEICELKNPVLKADLVYDSPYKVASLPHSIADKGIVVASSNNGAVKNIVNELPQKKEIGEQEFLEELDRVDYFKEISNQSYDKGNSEGDLEKNWGIFSIEGGNSQNLYQLRLTLEKLVGDLKRESYRSNQDAYCEFRQQYDKVVNERQRIQILADKAKEASNIKREKEQFESRFNKGIVEKSKLLSNQLDDFKKEFAILISETSQVKLELETEINYRTSKESQLTIAQQEFELVKLQSPSFLWLKKLFVPSKVSTYFDKLNRAHLSLKKSLNEYSKLKENINNKQVKLKNNADRISYLEKEQLDKQREYNAWKNTQKKRLFEYQERITCIQEELNQSNIAFPDFTKPYDQLQLSNFWFDESYRQEQSLLFIKALAVKKQFLFDNRKHFEKAIWIWNDQRKYLAKDNGLALIQAAWNWINFAIPIVSTTFASFGRMFENLSVNSIGKLFIDEAGQALPQASVGAIFRSRQVFVVGDPSQIQPVLSLDKNILGLFSQHYNVTDDYLSPQASTQSLVDATSQFGFRKMDGKWIGIPLWVHRRSNYPMFSISNRISYNDLMVQGKPIEISKGKGDWLNISGIAQDKYVVAQGEFLKEELKKRIAENPSLRDQIYVITPFKNVAYQLSKLLDEIAFTKRENGKVVNIGTVHTFQGKEAKIVYFVLGADRQSKGAATWAVLEPNIMNVAATRAKEEFYIIGDKELYQSLNSPVINETITILNNYNEQSKGN